MATRIYEVNGHEGKPRLIEAATAAQAIKIASPELRATVPDTMRVAELVAGGTKVEKAAVKS